MFLTETWKETEIPTKLYLIAKAREEEIVCTMTSSLWWKIEEIIQCWAEPAEKDQKEYSGQISPAHIKTYSLYWSRQDIRVNIQDQNLSLSSESGFFSGIDCEQFCCFHRISKYFSCVTGSKNWVLWISLTEKKHVLLLFWICLVWVGFINNHVVYGIFWREC